MTQTHERLTPAPPPGDFHDMPGFPQLAKVELKNLTQRRNLQHATTTIRDKRAKAVAEIENWQDLRLAGEAIKNRHLRHMDRYLKQLEENLTRAGATVHWARDGDEANRIVVDLIKAKHGTEVTKVKSMATQEIELNEALEEAGIAAWETDLAELIVQLGHDRPSHILVPAIHRNRSEVREIFLEEMGRYGTPAPDGLTDDPADLAGAARNHLRNKFLRTQIAISGANFAIAETGTLVVVESEGNGRMNLTLPETLISVVGIEKVLPTFDDLEVFLRLLPRSSTAERAAPYVSMWTGRTDGDGPQDVHVVLMDNGRTNVLADRMGRQALRCIRCSACLNICPVYEKVGGHAYGSCYPGPIGAILNPQLRGMADEVDKSLPFASSLCGACFEVCPVRINIPDVLVHLRQRVVDEKKRHTFAEPKVFGIAGWMFNDAKHFQLAQTGTSLVGKVWPRASFHHIPLPIAKNWTGGRDLPRPAKQTFRQWWKQNRGDAK